MCVFSHIQLFVTPRTVAGQASLFMEFRQEYWSGLLFPTPGDLPYPEIEPTSLASPTLAGGFFTTMTPGKPNIYKISPLYLLDFRIFLMKITKEIIVTLKIPGIKLFY